jgi:hypothetical protein
MAQFEGIFVMFTHKSCFSPTQERYFFGLLAFYFLSFGYSGGGPITQGTYLVAPKRDTLSFVFNF